MFNIIGMSFVLVGTISLICLFRECQDAKDYFIVSSFLIISLILFFMLFESFIIDILKELK
jgi:hypothetical protein